MQILGAHAGDVCSMSIRYEENIIVTGSVDRSIKIWDLRDLKCVQTFYGHEADVNSVYVSIFPIDQKPDDLSITFKIN